MPHLPRLELRAVPSTIYEDAILDEGAMLPQVSSEGDDDADYEVWLYWPSTSEWSSGSGIYGQDRLYEVRLTTRPLCPYV